VTATVGAAPGEGLGPLQPPGDTTGLFGVFKRRYLLKLLVQKELRVRYQASLLGFAWSYVKPLVRFFVYYLVIGTLLGLRDSVENFPLHIFAGLMFVTSFNETLTSGTKSVLKNKSLVRKMNVPREMFPVASVLVTNYHLFPQYVVMLGACVLVGWSPTPYALAAGVLAYLILFTFSLAVALGFSALCVYFRDFGNFVDTINILVRWSVPMIYPWTLVQETLPNWGQQLYLLNPVAPAVMLNQQCFWVPSLSNPADGADFPSDLMTRGLVMLLACVLLLGVAQWVFSRLETRFAERL
jgi:ABC-2 type transport system permease protein